MDAHRLGNNLHLLRRAHRTSNPLQQSPHDRLHLPNGALLRLGRLRLRDLRPAGSRPDRTGHSRRLWRNNALCGRLAGEGNIYSHPDHTQASKAKQLIGPAALAAGLPSSSLSTFLAAFPANATALASVPGATTDVLGAAT